ncbi:MAG: hypothetical protein ACR2JF_16810 [Iamia sp.]
MNLRAWVRAARVPALAAAVVVVGAVASGPLRPHAEGTPVPSSERVVIVAIPRLVVEDLGTGAVPTLDRLADEGALAAVATRTPSSRPTVEEAYLSISAGSRVEADVEDDGSYTVSPDSPTEPGTLGTALDEAGVPTTVIGGPPASAALADTEGRVDVEARATDFVVYEGGRTHADPELVADLLRPALEGPGVTLIDTGDTSRAARRRDALKIRAEAQARAIEELPPGDAPSGDQLVVDDPDVDEGEVLRQEALGDVEATLAAVVAEVDRAPGTTLFVMGVTPTENAPELSPLVIHAAGIEPGVGSSLTTDRPGLITIVDLTPTILTTVGATPPVDILGREVLLNPTGDGLAVVDRIDDVARSTTEAYGPSVTSLFSVQTIVLALVALWLFETRRRRGWGPRWLGVAMTAALLSLAAWPVATFLAGLRPSGLPSPGVTVVATWLIAATIGLGSLALGRRGPPALPLLLVALTTTAVIAVDIVTGARLQASTVLGHTAVAASRFHGVGNAAFGAFAAGALVAAALVVTVGRDRRRDVSTAAALLGVVLVLDVAPGLGADFGGVLSFVPASLLLLALLVGRRIRPRLVGLVVLVVGLGAIAVVGADLLRPAGSRTHIGEFAVDVFNDPGELWNTITRKWAVNMASLERTTWTRTLPAIAVALGVTLLSPRRREAFRRTSPTGPAFLAVTSLAAIGFLTNDSGLLVLGVSAVWLVPLVAIPAIAADTGVLASPPTPVDSVTDQPDGHPVPDRSAAREPTPSPAEVTEPATAGTSVGRAADVGPPS